MRNKNAKVSDPNKFFTNPGEEFVFEYSPIVAPDGTIDLRVSGQYSQKEMINSFKEETDMAYILKQIALGNMDVIQKVPGVFGDFTEFPKTYAELLQLRIDAEKSFYDLPVDVRSKFDNDFNQYFATAGTDPWLEKLGVLNKEEQPKEGVPDES